jgi:hypothetical protein
MGDRARQARFTKAQLIGLNVALAVSGIGLLSMIGAFATGAVNADNGSTVMAYLMGLFFMVALAVYGYGASAVGQDPPAHQPNDQTKEPSQLHR